MKWKSLSWEINWKSESGYWFLALVVILSEWAKNLSVIQRIRDLGFGAKNYWSPEFIWLVPESSISRDCLFK